MIEKLDSEMVDDGKRHPFVVALMKELRAKREAYSLEAESASAESTWRCLGRSSAYREVIRMIEAAKGISE